MKNILLAHLRIHYGIKPFVCKYCSKSFNEKGNLKTHIRIHTGERPFKCKQCNKGFKALGQLKDHFISHTGYKPFQCPYCKKFYRRKEILKNHINIHSKELFFKENKEKFQEMVIKVKQMKHINHNFEDLNKSGRNRKNKNDIIVSYSSSFSKEETKQNNISTFKSRKSSSSNNIEDKDKKLEKKIIFVKNNKIEKENYENNLLYYNEIKDEYILNDKLFKDECHNGWPNEINNLLFSTNDVSIKEDNKSIEQNDFHFEKKKFNFRKDENEKDIYYKSIKTNSLYLIFFDNNNTDNKNKYENDEFSNMTNLYLNEYENKNDIYEFVN